MQSWRSTEAFVLSRKKMGSRVGSELPAGAQTLVFYKEQNGSWFIDLPGWKGAKSDLLMVSGADTLLDIISDDGRQVALDVAEKPFAGSCELKLVRRGGPEGGAYYHIEKYEAK